MDIEDKAYKPELTELFEYVGNDAFEQLYRYMQCEYQAICSVEYSGDNVLLGWNLKYKKAGRTLCTVYPRKGHFPLLLIVGRKEKQCVEELLPTLSDEFCSVYLSTKEGMGQRWLLFDISDTAAPYDDILKVVRIRRQSSLKASQQ